MCHASIGPNRRTRGLANLDRAPYHCHWHSNPVRPPCLSGSPWRAYIRWCDLRDRGARRDAEPERPGPPSRRRINLLLGAVYCFRLHGGAFSDALDGRLRVVHSGILVVPGGISWPYGSKKTLAVLGAVPISGMGASYILLLTAFYVDNGRKLPLWRELPQLAFWILPSALGAPILLLALLRHPIARQIS